MEPETKGSVLIKRNLLDNLVFILEIVVLLVLIGSLGAGFIIHNERGNEYYLSYVTLGLAIASFFMLPVEGALLFTPIKEGKSPLKRLKAALVFSTLGLVFLFGASVFYLVCAYVQNTGNEGYDAYSVTFGWAASLLSLTFFLYELWHRAWIKENPVKTIEPVVPEKKPVPTEEPPRRKSVKISNRIPHKKGAVSTELRDGPIEGEYEEKP